MRANKGVMISLFLAAVCLLVPSLMRAASNEWSDGPVEPQPLERRRGRVSPGSTGTPATQGEVVTISGQQARTALRVPEASWIEHRSYDSFQEHSGQEKGSQVERKEAVPKSGVIGNIDIYYVYANDGKLMAEYDKDGSCIKEYIYVGDTLLAEYLPQIDATYYYLSDQVRSTRLITDESGAVVYSAAYGPFGEEMATWVDTYNPKSKFSGKEREVYSGQDYFGARYYDSWLRRFSSVDPIRLTKERLTDLQRYNLYSYVANSPLSYIDPTGEELHFVWDFRDDRISEEQRSEVIKGVEGVYRDIGLSTVVSHMIGDDVPLMGYNDETVHVIVHANAAFVFRAYGRSKRQGLAEVTLRDFKGSAEQKIIFLINAISHEVGHASGCLPQYAMDAISGRMAAGKAGARAENGTMMENAPMKDIMDKIRKPSDKDAEMLWRGLGR
jgi:RHS repeat-associated protein